MAIGTRWTRSGVVARSLLWWSAFAVCAFYGIFAFVMAALAILSLAGVVDNAPHRAAPVVFIIHALAGGIAFVIGPAQFYRRGLLARPRVHRPLGRVYVGAIWLASTSGLWLTAVFNVSVAAKLAFAVLAVLWFLSTTLAFIRARQRRFADHRAWMIRSYALSLFFVTFSLWPDLLALTGLPATISYPLAVFLSWSLNLAVAEFWIRRTRARPARLAAD